MDRLDLLGIRYDCEMEMKAKYDLAKEISDYWKKNCTDTNVMSDEFYKNCMSSIREKLSYESDVEDVWKIIEEEFLGD